MPNLRKQLVLTVQPARRILGRGRQSADPHGEDFGNRLMQAFSLSRDFVKDVIWQVYGHRFHEQTMPAKRRAVKPFGYFGLGLVFSSHP